MQLYYHLMHVHCPEHILQ